MAHQTAISSTTSVPVTYTSGPTVQQEHSIGVSITPLVGTGGNSTVVVTATTNCSATTSAITVNHNAPVSGSYSATYRNLYIYVPGVLTLYAFSTISGTVGESPNPTAPTVSATQTFPGTEAASATGAVTLSSAGTGNATDVFQYALFPYNTSSNFSYTNSFSITRGSSYSYGAARERYNGTDRVFASYVTNILFPYLSPTQSGSLTGATIAYSASTTYTFGNPNVASTHDYRINSGTANSAAVTVPSAAGTYAFSLQTRRKVASGGDGSTWSSSFGSVNIIREAAPVSPPTAIALNPATTESNSTSVAATTSGGTAGGTLQVSDNNSSWVTNGTSPSNKTRGTQYTFYGRRVLNSVASSSTSQAYTVPYLVAVASGSLTAATIAYTAPTSYTIVFASNVASTHDYRINSGTVNSAAVTVPATAGAHAFSLQTRRKVASGGDGSTWSSSFGSVNITRSAAGSAPAITVADNSNAGTSVTATITLSSEGSGGTGVEYSNGGAWQTSPNTFSQNRNTTVSYTARRSGINLESNTVSHVVGYLTGDTSVSATSSTISSSATSASTTISNGTSGETYAVRLNNGSTNIVTRVGNGSLTIPSSDLPSGANTITYEIFVLRPTSTGGDGSTYTATDDTFTVTRSAAAAGTYGVRISNSSGTLTLDENTRVGNIMCSGTASITASTYSNPYWVGTSASITLTGMTSSNTSEYDVWLGNAPAGSSGFSSEGVVVNRGTNSFTLTYQSLVQNSNATIKYMGFRY